MDRIDLHRLAQLLDLMGRAPLLALAGLLADGLAALDGLPQSQRSDHLHRLQGGAASLGFAGLAAALAETEAANGDVAALAEQAPAVVPAMDAALHAINCQR